MKPTVAPDLAARHLSRLENLQPAMAKAHLKNLEQDGREQMGRIVVRCFLLAGVSQKEAAGLVNRDQGQVARWCSGAERPAFDVIFAVALLRRPLVVAFAEVAGEGVEVVTEIRVRRIA